MSDRKCLELSKTLADPTITAAACIAFQGFNPPKCKECEWGDNEKAPKALPEIIVQDSQISEITPKEVLCTEAATKTILGHSGRPKAKIEGFCQRRNENLTWNACLQRFHRGINLCESCDPNKEFQFSEQPMGQGWHNSAARAGEMVCPELDGRKLKKSTCIMRQGKKRKAGKSCDCQFWKGEKMGTYLKNESLTYFCLTPYCPHRVEVEGMLCEECQLEKLKEINPLQPHNYYERKVLKVLCSEPDGPPQHSIETFCRLLKKHPEIYRVLAEKAEREIRSLEEQIVWELRKAVKDGKEVEGDLYAV